MPGLGAGGLQLHHLGAVDGLGADHLPQPRRRIAPGQEFCFPIDNGHLRRRIIQQGLQNYLDDNQQAWELDKHGVWNRVQMKEGSVPHMAQAILLEKLSK